MRFWRDSKAPAASAAGPDGSRAPITVHDERGLAAAAPAYIKTHSFGEFVFDFSWAQAYAQHDLAYYPKLVLGVPFTPATAPRLLVRPGVDAAGRAQGAGPRHRGVRRGA